MKVAAPVMAVRAEVLIALPEPREVPTFRGDSIAATHVMWERRVRRDSEGDDHDLVSTTLFADDFCNVTLYGDIPSWVPRPPDGWDAGVVAVCKSAAVSA